jgi:hypothetical protein
MRQHLQFCGVSHKAQDQAREVNKGVGAQICQSRSSQVDLMVESNIDLKHAKLGKPMKKG